MINKLERVMWRMRSKKPNSSSFKLSELKRAIMVECGTSPQTYYNNRDALKALGWIKILRGKKIITTNKDLSGNY